MTHLRVAVSFLTILPVGPKQLPARLAPSVLYFPLVGLVLGCALWGLDTGLREVFPSGLSSAIVLVFLIAATRALHVDGFLDCCDALFGAHTRERRLEILRDPHVGAFAVIGGAALLLVQWSSLAALPDAVRPEVLLLMPCLSRLAIAVGIFRFPYARKEGLGAAFQLGKSWALIPAALVLPLAAGVLLAGWAGLIFVAIAIGVAVLLGAWIARLLGGLTGDGYGAINEVTMVALLAAAAAFVERAPQLFDAPLAIG